MLLYDVILTHTYCIEITTHPQDMLVPVGSSVSLTCKSSVSSDVTFSWTRDGRDVTGQSTSTGDTSILTINKARSRNAGDYLCIVRNGSLLVMSNTATLGKLFTLYFLYYMYVQVLQTLQFFLQVVMYQYEEASLSCVELVV